MTFTLVREPSEQAYSPRQMSALGIWDIGDWRFKAYLIRASTERRVSDAMLAAARMKISSARETLDSVPHFNTGFIVIHEGALGNWLIANWWYQGGSLAQKTWFATSGSPATFVDAPATRGPCVWDLVPIDFERRTWVNAVMKASGGGLVNYLLTVMPDGNY